MEMACAGCGCLVDRGVRVATCGEPGCCCSALVTRESLDVMAEQIRHAFGSRDMDAFGQLLADDVRWGDDDAPNACHNRSEVVGTFQSFIAEGVGGEVTEVEIGPAGVLCQLRVHWPDPADRERRAELFHLYRVRGGRIIEIEPYDERDAAEAALATL